MRGTRRGCLRLKVNNESWFCGRKLSFILYKNTPLLWIQRQAVRKFSLSQFICTPNKILILLLTSVLIQNLLV